LKVFYFYLYNKKIPSLYRTLEIKKKNKSLPFLRSFLKEKNLRKKPRDHNYFFKSLRKGNLGLL